VSWVPKPTEFVLCFLGKVHSKLKEMQFQKRKKIAVSTLNPGQAARLCKLSWLFNDAKSLPLSIPAG
jgi:hypothetical protein